MFVLNIWLVFPLSAKLSLTGFFSYNIKTVHYAQGREITNRPSDKDRMGMKTLGLWVVKVWDRDGRILFHELLLNFEITLAEDSMWCNHGNPTMYFVLNFLVYKFISISILQFLIASSSRTKIIMHFFLTSLATKA
jgi:hypothetical protein